METTETIAPDYYKPNEVISYKSIEGNTTFYPVVKITDLEIQIHNTRMRIESLEKTLDRYANQISDITDLIRFKSLEVPPSSSSDDRKKAA